MTEQILQVMREEGQLMRQALDICTETKSGPGDLVTNYDRRVQADLERKLLEILPGAGFLGEEGLDTLPEADCGTFIIDPIDGTMNFSRSYQRSSISVALVQGGQVVFGAIYDPYLDEMFHAKRGEGAFLNGRPIRVSDRPLEESLVMIGTTPYEPDRAPQTFAIARALFDRTLDFRRSGSAAIDLCSVAAGRAEIFYEYALSPWDYAAGGLIIEEAGGKCSTFDGTPVSLTNRSSVFACNAVTYDEARSILQEALA